MATPATAQYTSTTRLQRVRELWIAGRANREELGRLLYEERNERQSVGGAGNRTGFHQWLRDAGISKQSAYRRIAEYEITIGVRAPEDDYDRPASPVPVEPSDTERSDEKPVPTGTSSQTQEPVKPVEPEPVRIDDEKVLQELFKGMGLFLVKHDQDSFGLIGLTTSQVRTIAETIAKP